MLAHKNYLKLTAAEKQFVDDSLAELFRESKRLVIPLAGDDRCEAVVESLATWIVQSRPLHL